jgi:hypothetical protein
MRPIVVLLLVLLALAALVFGVFSLLGGSEKGPGSLGPGGQPVATAEPSPGVEVDLVEPAAGGRETAPLGAQGQRAPDGGARARAGELGNSLTGTVLTPEGQPLGGALVTLSTHGAEEIVFVNDPVDKSRDISSRTDKQGRYTFTNVPPRDRYRIIAEHQDYARTDMISNPISERGAFEEPPLRMERGARLTGTVSDVGGNRVPGATLFLDSAFTLADGSPADRMTARSDQEGAYVFENVPKGEQMRTMTVKAPGYAQVMLSGIAFQKDQDELARDVVLQPALMLAGRVVGPGNVGIAGVRILALGTMTANQGTRTATQSREDGGFLFEDLGPGKYMLQPVKQGWLYKELPRADAGEANVIIEMYKLPCVSGTVVDAKSGKPVAGFGARLRFFYQEDVPTAPSDIEGAFKSADGSFELCGVREGKYVVEAWADGFAPSYSTPITVTAQQDVGGVEVALKEGGALVGRVVDSDGAPIAGALVRTEDNEWVDDLFQQALGSAFPTNATTREARTEKDGSFRVEHLNPARYQLIVSAPGFTDSAVRDLAVSEGVERQLGDLRLGRGGTLQGKLYDGAGQPIVAGMVTLEPTFLPSDGSIPKRYESKSGADGGFRFANVLPGTYRILATRRSSNANNPFEALLEAKNSERQVTLIEGEVVTQDLAISE